MGCMRKKHMWRLVAVALLASLFAAGLPAGAQDDPAARPIIEAGNAAGLHEIEAWRLTHPDWVRALAFHPTDSAVLATACDDGIVRVWTLGAADEAILLGSSTLATDLSENRWITALAFNPDGTRVAAGYFDGSVRVWDLTLDGTPLILVAERGVTGHTDVVTRVTFGGPEGAWLAAASYDHTARLWDLSTIDPYAEPVAVLPHAGVVTGLLLEGDTPRVTTASVIFGTEPGQEITAADHIQGRIVAAELRVWDDPVTNPVEPVTVPLPEDMRSEVFRAALLPVDGGMLVATMHVDGSLSLFQAAQELRAELVGHTDWARALAINPANTLLATASDDTTAAVWAMPTEWPDEPLAPLAVLSGHTDWLDDVAFSPDGTLLATSSDDGTVRLWAVVTPEPEADS